MADNPSGLKDLLLDYLERSSTTSTIARNSGFAGIAIIWLFKKEVPGEINLPPELVSPLAYLVLFLIIDFLHYFIGTIVGGIAHRLAAAEVEGGKKTEADVEFPVGLSILNWTFWFGKMVPFLIGYYLLLQQLLQMTKS